MSKASIGGKAAKKKTLANAFGRSVGDDPIVSLKIHAVSLTNRRAQSVVLPGAVFDRLTVDRRPAAHSRTA